MNRSDAGAHARELLAAVRADLPRDRKRNSVFRTDVVGLAIGAAARLVEQLPASQRAEVGELVVRRRRAGDVADELARFAIVLAILGGGSLEQAAAGALLRHGLTCLQRVGVGPEGSRLSYLHTDLRAAMARSGASSFATTLAGARRDGEGELTAVAERSLIEQGSVDALCRLIEVETGAAVDDARADELRLARARVLRLAGKSDEARSILETLGGERAKFERATLDAMATADLEPFFLGLRRRELDPTPDDRAVLHLWAHAAKRKPWTRLAPRPSGLKRLGAHPMLVRATELLERLYLTTLPLAARVEACGRLLDLAEELPSVTAELLAVGAAARWLVRSKQPDLARVAIRRYVALCRTLSEGRAADLFGLDLPAPDGAEDEGDPSFVAGVAPDPRDRGMGILRLGVSMLATAAAGRGDGSATDYAMILTEHLRVFKGPAMKLGQMLSFYGAPLPGDALESLAELQSQAAPVDFSEVRARFEKEQKRDLATTFASFEEEPIAVGSVAQVHLARTHEGDLVAVKVLFPAIEECIRRDFRGLRVLIPLLAVWMPHWEWSALLQELELQMLAECDLIREGEVQTAFRARFEGDPAIVIPRVLPHLGSPGILVSEYFEGVGVAELARTGTAPRRTRAAEAIARYVISTVLAGEFNTDLHPGNVLFDESRVCFVDFGNVRTWKHGEQRGWTLMFEAMLRSDMQLFREGVEATEHCGGELTADVLEQTFQALKDNLGTFLASDEPVRIDKQAILTEIMAFAPGGAFGRFKMRIPAAYVYAFRIYWGCIAIIGDLDVPIAARPICLAALEPS